MQWLLFGILFLFILIVAWIGNMIADKSSDAVRNRNIRKYLEENPAKQELLSDRFK